jgi:hypothetical protein
MPNSVSARQTVASLTEEFSAATHRIAHSLAAERVVLPDKSDSMMSATSARLGAGGGAVTVESWPEMTPLSSTHSGS